MKYTHFEKYALEVYEFCHITTFPINCFDVAEKLGLKVISYQEKANGNETTFIEMMKVSSDAFLVRKESTIYYNAKVQSKKRISFSLAHEIGHAVLVSNDEDDADCFASELLVPRAIVFAQHLHTADGISKYFNVSIAAANQSLVGDFYLPSETGLKIISHFNLEHKCPELFWNPPEPFIPKEIIVPQKITMPSGPSFEEWKAKTEEIETMILNVEKQLSNCKSEKRYNALCDKLAELDIKMNWQTEIGEKYGFSMYA